MVPYPLGPLGRIKRQLRLQRKPNGIGRMLKRQIKRIPLRRNFVPPVIRIALAADPPPIVRWSPALTPPSGTRRVLMVRIVRSVRSSRYNVSSSSFRSEQSLSVLREMGSIFPRCCYGRSAHRRRDRRNPRTSCYHHNPSCWCCVDNPLFWNRSVVAPISGSCRRVRDPPFADGSYGWRHRCSDGSRRCSLWEVRSRSDVFFDCFPFDHRHGVRRNAVGNLCYRTPEGIRLLP